MTWVRQDALDHGWNFVLEDVANSNYICERPLNNGAKSVQTGTTLAAVLIGCEQYTLFQNRCSVSDLTGEPSP